MQKVPQTFDDSIFLHYSGSMAKAWRDTPDDGWSLSVCFGSKGCNRTQYTERGVEPIDPGCPSIRRGRLPVSDQR